MKIKSFHVDGLPGRKNQLRVSLGPDLNVLTGRNGSGKTNLLKLMWYLVSGNILVALRDVPFKKATIVTDLYEYSVVRLSSNTCRIEWEDEEGIREFEDERDLDDDVIFNAEDQAHTLLWNKGSSVFFPTFRRIEGGFTLSERTFPTTSRTRADIEDSLIALSKRLSHNKHVFVSALSTVDVVGLLVRQYTDLSEEYNLVQQKTSQEIIQDIKNFKSESSEANLNNANRLLDAIRTEIEGMESSREAIMRPLEAVRGLAMRLFRHAGIKLGKSLNFGDAAEAVNSDALSAGEKQMLSFIAYNAFYKDAIVVIDEPELSLHVDWQRQLFPILMNQQASNQFIIATHSPFIYSKYPDKEIQIDPERGDEEE